MERARLAGPPALPATVKAAEAAGRRVPVADADLADRLLVRAAGRVQGSALARPAATGAPKAREVGVLEGLLQQVAARHRKTWRLQLAGAAASLTLLAGAVGGTSPAVIGAVGAVRGRRSSGPWVRSVAGGHRGRGCGPWPAVIGSVDSEATPPGPTMPAPSRTFSGHDPATGVTAQSGRARSRSPVARRAVSSVLLAKVNEHGPASVLT